MLRQRGIAVTSKRRRHFGSEVGSQCFCVSRWQAFGETVRVLIDRQRALHRALHSCGSNVTLTPLPAADLVNIQEEEGWLPYAPYAQRFYPGAPSDD